MIRLNALAYERWARAWHKTHVHNEHYTYVSKVSLPGTVRTHAHWRNASHFPLLRSFCSEMLASKLNAPRYIWLSLFVHLFTISIKWTQYATAEPRVKYRYKNACKYLNMPAIVRIWNLMNSEPNPESLDRNGLKKWIDLKSNFSNYVHVLFP